MNIFYLDEDVSKCAQYHCDKHVLKMTVESIQMLGSAYYLQHGFKVYKNLRPEELEKMKEIFEGFPRDRLYKISHPHHPSTKWVASSINNWNWLLELGMNLTKEFAIRYNKIHATQPRYEWMNKNLSNDPWTPPPVAQPLIYKKSDPIESHRNFYFNEKVSFAKWDKLLNEPTWFTELRSRTLNEVTG